MIFSNLCLKTACENTLIGKKVSWQVVTVFGGLVQRYPQVFLLTDNT